MEICNNSACTGCLVCVDTCATGAISVQINAQGFNVPSVDEAKCVGCNRCKAVCPVNEQKKNPMAKTVYAGWVKNKSARLAATSGGLFTILAKKFIASGGVVYGAAYVDNMNVAHIRVDREQDVERLRGSKYVQSNTYSIYHLVRQDLNSGRRVLFSGTPCQVGALKNYIGNADDNLICVDIMCHGVPSPAFFSDYRKSLEIQYGSKMKKLNFRYKKPNWTVFSMKADFENGSKYMASKYQDPYLCFFSLGGGI